MKVRVKPNGNYLDAAEIKAALQEELISGSVMSVSALPQKTEAFIIKLKPATNHKMVNKICKKLNDTGYSTKVISVGRQAPGRTTGLFYYRSFSSHYISRNRAGKIILVKVNSPNLPNNPHGLPDPGGKKPNKGK